MPQATVCSPRPGGALTDANKLQRSPSWARVTTDSSAILAFKTFLLCDPRAAGPFAQTGGFPGVDGFCGYPRSGRSVG